MQRSATIVFGYRATSTTLASMCADADDQLFAKVTCNTQHLLHDLLPPLREQHFSLRERSHNYCLDSNVVQRFRLQSKLFSFTLTLIPTLHKLCVCIFAHKPVYPRLTFTFFYLPSCCIVLYCTLLSGCGLSTFY